MPTTGRGIEYPASTDAPRVWEDLQALADSVETAIDDLDADAPTLDSSVGSAAANFVLNDANVYALLNRKIIFFHLYIQTTNALTTSTGNISDVTCFTLDSGLRPPQVVSSVFGNGLVTGECILNTDGTVNLRSASDTVSAGSNLRMTFTYLRT